MCVKSRSLHATCFFFKPHPPSVEKIGIPNVPSGIVSAARARDLLRNSLMSISLSRRTLRGESVKEGQYKD